jgi:hypothetical protein
MKTVLAVLAFAGVAGVANADIMLGDLRVDAHYNIGETSAAPAVVDPNARYSNITTFSGSAQAQGASALQGTNTITRMLMDDITPVGVTAGERVTTVRFTVANLNTVAVSARARIRFWNADGVAGGPGTYYNGLVGAATAPAAVGFTFNALSFAPGVTVLTGSFTGAEWSMPTTAFWAGLTFDNNGGGDQTALFNNLGQGIYNPVDLGSSADTAFLTGGGGSFFNVANPAGQQFNYNGNPAANFGWEFVVVPSPSASALLGLGGLMAARRRR